MKKIIVTSVLLFVFTVFISVNSFSQTQEPVKTEKAKTQCPGHGSSVAKTTQCSGHSADGVKTTDLKTGETPKACSAKCKASCEAKKGADGKGAATTSKKKAVPQK